ncbi:flagellar basal-body rod protein FlgG [Methylocystis sp. Sn-Cys]|uniref:flagellar basal-body rod protein FlgG n=1 Tax=Methylocystis sp. Sn-Cys TaxID=1701263 RepID=UPI001924A962|nr:flagellar basal-body rod protein FlgG [Methylocystis sp. Sn-Cys]MBL1258664.1 flagellar basal-body rod protein FlgG [Methylocystis sp. Sn-Cys]
MRALAIAATGMSAQQQNIEVISNNIANINTTAFKRSRAEFTDLLYQAERLQGVSNRGRDAIVPQGSQTGLGVRLAAIRSLQVQGPLSQTGNSYDLAINGSGWFQITGPNNEILYTRSGSYSTNANSQLVTVDGYLLSPTITIPNNAVSVSVSQSGLVTAVVAGQTAPQQLGQLTTATFPNDAGLEALGGNLFRETAASGTPVVGVPGDIGYGVIAQGYVESSNVDPVKELVSMISAQRAFELNSKVIQTVDDMAGTITKGIR